MSRSKPEADKKRPTHDIFIVDGDGDKAFWTKIGAAWEHDDGEGFSITLTAVPLTGRLVARKPKPKAERGAEG